MFDIDERGKTAVLLGLGYDRECKRGFPGRLRTKHFDNPASWKSANAKSAIDQNVAGGDDVDIDNLFVAKTHDRAVAVIFRDLLNRQIEILISRDGEFVCAGLLFSFRRHIEVTVITSPPTVRQAEKASLGNQKAANLKFAAFDFQKTGS